jgi:hypothetical protein
MNCLIDRSQKSDNCLMISLLRLLYSRITLVSEYSKVAVNLLQGLVIEYRAGSPRDRASNPRCFISALFYSIPLPYYMVLNVHIYSKNWRASIPKANSTRNWFPVPILMCIFLQNHFKFKILTDDFPYNLVPDGYIKLL